MKLTTTLNLIRAKSPCPSGYKILTRYLGEGFSHDAEINLLTILDSNGVLDMLWCLCATEQDSKHIAVQMAIEFAELVLPIFEKSRPSDARPRQCIQATKDYLNGKISIKELGTTRKAAYAAACDATDRAAATAAHAANTASYAVSYDAAAAANGAAAYAADALGAAAYAADAYSYDTTTSAEAKREMWEKQVEIIRMTLT